MTTVSVALANWWRCTFCGQWFRLLAAVGHVEECRRRWTDSDAFRTPNLGRSANIMITIDKERHER